MLVLKYFATLTFIVFLSSCSSSSDSSSDTTTTTTTTSVSPTISVSSHNTNTLIRGTSSITLEGSIPTSFSIDSLTYKVNNDAEKSITLNNNTFSFNYTPSYSKNILTFTATSTDKKQGTLEFRVNRVPIGALDNSFGEDINPNDGTPDGFTVLDIDGSHDTAKGIVIDSQGRSYVAAYGKISTGSHYDIIILRYLTSGLLDTSYGSNAGYTNVDVNSLSKHDFPTRIILDSQERALVIGNTDNGTDKDLFILRFNTTGTLDSSFGSNNGIVIHDLNSTDEGNGIIIDENKNIYIAGKTNPASTSDIIIWKFLENGTLDTSFNSQGYVLYDSTGTDSAKDIVLDSNKNLIITGVASGKMLLIKYDLNGNLISSFGTAGIVNDLSGSGSSIILNEDDEILVSGGVTLDVNDRRYDMAIWKYSNSGKLDITFGGDENSDNIPDGFVYHDRAAGNNNKDWGHDIEIDSNSNILVSGESEGPTSDPDMVIWRFTKDGKLDTTFANGVGFFTQNGAGTNKSNLERAYGISQNSYGDILLAGDAYGTGSEIAIWKFK